MRFSGRTGWECGENEWSAARAAARPGILDLSQSSPLQCGLGPAVDGLLSPLSDPGALEYTPDPLGMPRAREAVVRYYADHGAEVAADRICLTTSTSEAYSFLFRLLCDPGDEVLIARPSYPLFDLLAQLDDVLLRAYPLHYDPGAHIGESGSWSVDFHALQEAITGRTRAIVVVHPNNPTGNFTSRQDRRALQILCAERGLALIVDEVFLDYAVSPDDSASVSSDDSASVSSDDSASVNSDDSARHARSFTVGASPCLQFVLSGLSKICALPQMKLSWIACGGPSESVKGAMERLEIIADTFLSLNSPVQFALPHWLKARHATQHTIRRRLRSNLAILDRRLPNSLASRFATEGGWTVVLRVPSTVADVEFSLAAMQRGVLVQPGTLYGLPAGRAVLSLLTPPDIWAEGLGRLPIDGTVLMP